MRSSGRRVFLRPAGAAVALICLAAGAPRRAGAYEQMTVMAPMRDGVRLSTNVFVPAGGKKYPALLMRTPYGKEIGNVMVTAALSKGFAWVVQDTRGRFESEGTSMSFLDEAEDGYDTVEWAAAQPWCDGRVGTVGISAMGINQYVMLPKSPPHLRCAYVMAAAQSLYHDAAYHGGAFRRALVIGWTMGNKLPLMLLELLMDNPDYGPIWHKVNLSERYGSVRVPVMHVGGWYDIFLQGNIDAFNGLQEKGGEGARGKQRLIIGPWTHGGWGALRGFEQGELTYPTNSKYDFFTKVVPWFEECIKGKDRGFQSGPAVRYYLMGDPEDESAPGNEWLEAESWPPPAEPTPFYFHADGRLSVEKPGVESASLTFRADPADPVPTIGGGNLELASGTMDQRAIEKRDDVLVFTTEPLSEPLAIAGPVKAVLHVSTDVPDTDFTARLTDVYPDGRSMLVMDGILRASHRDGYERRTPLEPGKLYALTVDLWDTAIVFNRGHRVRVIIAGSNFPRFDANLNNGKVFDLEAGELERATENVWEYIKMPDAGADSRVANNVLRVDASHSSHLVLPLVSAGE
ncbi:MAG: CocE/NonD family hydrolase [bacterium]